MSRPKAGPCWRWSPDGMSGGDIHGVRHPADEPPNRCADCGKPADDGRDGPGGWSCDECYDASINDADLRHEWGER